MGFDGKWCNSRIPNLNVDLADLIMFYLMLDSALN